MLCEALNSYLYLATDNMGKGRGWGSCKCTFRKPRRRYWHLLLPKIRNRRRRILLVFVPWQNINLETLKVAKFVSLVHVLEIDGDEIKQPKTLRKRFKKASRIECFERSSYYLWRLIACVAIMAEVQLLFSIIIWYLLRNLSNRHSKDDRTFGSSFPHRISLLQHR